MILTLAIMLSAGMFSAGTNGGALGDWMGPTKSIVRVYECGSAVCLKIVKLQPDPPSTHDGHNPDAALRARPLCGLEIGSGFTNADTGKLDGGRLYDPISGRTYKGTITAEGDLLKLRGYIGISMFGRSETWTRVAHVETCK